MGHMPLRVFKDGWSGRMYGQLSAPAFRWDEAERGSGQGLVPEAGGAAYG